MGADGPDADKGAFDLTIQAIGGFMSITGERGGKPIKVGTSIFDLVCGLNAYSAIVMSLYRRQQCGRGQHVETSLLEGEVAFLVDAALEYLVSGHVRERWGSEHSQLVPYKAFETSDGLVVIGAGYESVFRPFLEVIGRMDLLEDPRFATLAARVESRDAVYAVLDAEVRRHRTDDLLARMESAGVPCARVNDVRQVFEHPQVLHRRMRMSLQHPIYGDVPAIGPAVKYSGFDVTDGWSAPPLLGEHEESVLADWLGESGPTRPSGMRP